MQAERESFCFFRGLSQEPFLSTQLKAHSDVVTTLCDRYDPGLLLYESILLLSVGTVMAPPGSPNPTTSYSLFERLRSDETRREAMAHFVERYTLFIISRIRRTAPLLQQEDISDIAQNIFSKVWDGTSRTQVLIREEELPKVVCRCDQE
jgi:hypothetical protein